MWSSHSLITKGQRQLFAGVVSLCLAASVMLPAYPARAGEITVFAAASLKSALDDLVSRWEAETDNEVTVSYAGTSALARQIQQGAPADLFISANADWMDVLEEDGLLLTDTRQDLLGNSLVLVSPSAEGTTVDDDDLVDILRRETADGYLAMALVQAVPAGIYGKQALDALGLWDDLRGSVAQSDNVRAALMLVALGEAQLGIVYATDAMAEGRVAVRATVPPKLHDLILYPAAVIADGQETTARAFLDYLSGAAAAQVFRAYGFTIPTQQGAG